MSSVVRTQRAEPVIRPLGVITNIEGTSLTADDNALIQDRAVSGLILFSRNYDNPHQLKQLSDAIKALRPDMPLFVDQEGGRVQRFREGFTRLPPMLELQRCWQQSSALAKHSAEQLGWLMAAELALCGVDVSFAPVLDIERGVSRVIGDRAFATDAALVTELAGAFITGMNRVGMKAVGKHFPGHGAIEADSHLEWPVDQRSLAQLDYDMRPFRSLTAQGLLQGIMPAHVLFPALDRTHTAGFSAAWLQLLKQQVGFDGVIFSDDLSMAGAAHYGSYQQRAHLAAAAGCHALVVCNDRAGAWEIIETVRHKQDSDKCSDGRFHALDLQDWCLNQTSAALLHRDIADVRQSLQQSGLISA